ncbi:hypothetical protein KKHLCK_04870 [Candidatus Electrothrix laxa]
MITLVTVFSLLETSRAEAEQASKKPVYFSCFTHQEDTYISKLDSEPEHKDKPWSRGPEKYLARATNILETWTQNNIRGEYATIGAALQQLNDAHPELLEQIKEQKLPVTHYDGAGHIEPAAVGRLKNLAGMSLNEAICALWNAETRTLVPNWHLENGRLVPGNPRAGEPITLEELPAYNLPQKETWLYGGILAVERLLGVIPLDFFQSPFRNLGRDNESAANPITAVKRALGMGSYEVSYHPDTPMSTGRMGLSATYLAANWPRDLAFYARPVMKVSHIKELLARPDDFTLVAPDPKKYQWEPVNAALAFFHKTYGVNSFAEVLEMPCPVDFIKKLMTAEEKQRLLSVIKKMTENEERHSKEGPETWSQRMLTGAEARDWQDYLFGVFEGRREIPSYLILKQQALSAEVIAEAAKDLMLHWPRPNHDGDLGGPPDYVHTEQKNLSLAEAFAAFAFMLEQFAVNQEIPQEVVVENILGPVDYPLYELAEEPKLDVEKLTAVSGWQPYELDKKYFPDSATVFRQGLVPTSFLPFSVDANEVSVMQAAIDAAGFIRKNGHVPGSIEIFLPPSEKKDGVKGDVKEEKVFANAAELLYGMAQVVYKLSTKQFPGSARMVSVKIIKDQVCRYVVNSSAIHYAGGRFQADWLDSGFIWRAWVPVSLLNSSWTYRP